MADFEPDWKRIHDVARGWNPENTVLNALKEYHRQARAHLRAEKAPEPDAEHKWCDTLGCRRQATRREAVTPPEPAPVICEVDGCKEGVMGRIDGPSSSTYVCSSHYELLKHAPAPAPDAGELDACYACDGAGGYSVAINDVTPDHWEACKVCSGSGVDSEREALRRRVADLTKDYAIAKDDLDAMHEKYWRAADELEAAKAERDSAAETSLDRLATARTAMEQEDGLRRQLEWQEQEWRTACEQLSTELEAARAVCEAAQGFYDDYERYELLKKAPSNVVLWDAVDALRAAQGKGKK